MRKIPSDQPQNFEDELLAEYSFDYQKAKPNRFAVNNETSEPTVVVLNKDIAQVFKTPEAVNKVLRSLFFHYRLSSYVLFYDFTDSCRQSFWSVAEVLAIATKNQPARALHGQWGFSAAH